MNNIPINICDGIDSIKKKEIKNRKWKTKSTCHD